MDTRLSKHYQTGYKPSIGLIFLRSPLRLRAGIVLRQYVMLGPGLRMPILAGMKGHFLRLNLTVGVITCIFTLWLPNVTGLTRKSKRVLERGLGSVQFQS